MGTSELGAWQAATRPALLILMLMLCRDYAKTTRPALLILMLMLCRDYAKTKGSSR